MLTSTSFYTRTKLVLLIFVIQFLFIHNQGFLQAEEDPEEKKEKMLWGKFSNFIIIYNKTYSSNQEMQSRYKTYSENLDNIDNILLKNKTFQTKENGFFDLPFEIFRERFFDHNINIVDSLNYYPSNQLNSVNDVYMYKGINRYDVLLPSYYYITDENMDHQNKLTKNTNLKVKTDNETVNMIQNCQTNLIYSDFTNLRLFTSHYYILETTQFNFFNFKNKYSHIFVDVINENVLRNFLYFYGTIQIAINADEFQFYSKNDSKYSDIVQQCISNDVNHIVTLVGYGTDNGVDYWIIRNTWGNKWGDKGHMKLIRNKGACGLSKYVFIPISLS